MATSEISFWFTPEHRVLAPPATTKYLPRYYATTNISMKARVDAMESVPYGDNGNITDAACLFFNSIINRWFSILGDKSITDTDICYQKVFKLGLESSMNGSE